MKRLLGCALLAGLLAAGCKRGAPTPDEEPPPGPPWFVEVTEESGLTFVHDPGPAGSYFMPQSMGQFQGDDNEGYTDGWDHDVERYTTAQPLPDYSSTSGDGAQRFGGSHTAWRNRPSSSRSAAPPKTSRSS